MAFPQFSHVFGNQMRHPDSANYINETLRRFIRKDDSIILEDSQVSFVMIEKTQMLQRFSRERSKSKRRAENIHVFEKTLLEL
jgi:hypothetical protein